jgi:hypothetical protein
VGRVRLREGPVPGRTVRRGGRHGDRAPAAQGVAAVVRAGVPARRGVRRRGRRRDRLVAWPTPPGGRSRCGGRWRCGGARCSPTSRRTGCASGSAPS